MRQLIFKISIVLSVIFAILYLNSCNSKTKANENSASPQNLPLEKKSCQCDCSTNLSNCDPCVTDFFGGATKRTFTIQWLSCVSPAGSTFPGTSSTIEFCVENNGQCDVLCAKLLNPPTALICFSDPTCFKPSLRCTSNGGYSLTYQGGGVDWSVTISAIEDPKFIVTCTDLLTGNSYNCIGEMY